MIQVFQLSLTQDDPCPLLRQAVTRLFISCHCLVTIAFQNAVSVRLATIAAEGCGDELFALSRCIGLTLLVALPAQGAASIGAEAPLADALELTRSEMAAIIRSPTETAFIDRRPIGLDFPGQGAPASAQILGDDIQRLAVG